MPAPIAPSSRGGLLLRLVLAGGALLALAAVVVVLALRGSAPTPGPSWVRGAAVSSVRARGPVYVPAARAFLVATGSSRVIAISAHSPQMGERVRYCASDGWFEDPLHGSKFDGLGRYVLGPAPHGLDRFAVRMLDGVAWIDPAALTTGPPRGVPTTAPSGPFCVHE